MHWEQFVRDTEDPGSTCAPGWDSIYFILRKVIITCLHVCLSRDPPPGYLDNRKQQLYLWYYIFTTLSGYYTIVELGGESLPFSLGIIPDKLVNDSYSFAKLFHLFQLFMS